MIKHIPGGNHILGDVIPVDFVSDYCITAGGICANNKELNVFHSGSSSKNPTTWGFTRDMCILYW
jgi:hypothetical protein